MRATSMCHCDGRHAVLVYCTASCGRIITDCRTVRLDGLKQNRTLIYPSAPTTNPVCKPSLAYNTLRECFSNLYRHYICFRAPKRTAQGVSNPTKLRTTSQSSQSPSVGFSTSSAKRYEICATVISATLHPPAMRRVLSCQCQQNHSEGAIQDSCAKTGTSICACAVTNAHNRTVIHQHVSRLIKMHIC